MVWLSGIVIGTAAAAGACDAPDPGEITFSERSKTESSSGSSGQASSSSGASSTSSSGTPGTDGGGSSSGEAGAADPVFGNSAFAAGNPGQNANGANAAHAGNVEGKNCIQAGCHLDAANAKWGFGGTVYTKATGGTTVKNAEVRVTGPDGKTFGMAYTDDNGNFWFDGAGAKPPANSRVGVRDATKKKVMTGTVAGDPGAACNAPACHGNTAMRIFLE